MNQSPYNIFETCELWNVKSTDRGHFIFISLLDSYTDRNALDRKIAHSYEFLISFSSRTVIHRRGNFCAALHNEKRYSPGSSVTGFMVRAYSLSRRRCTLARYTCDTIAENEVLCGIAVIERRETQGYAPTAFFMPITRSTRDRFTCSQWTDSDVVPLFRVTVASLHSRYDAR